MEIGYERRNDGNTEAVLDSVQCLRRHCVSHLGSASQQSHFCGRQLLKAKLGLRREDQYYDDEEEDESLYYGGGIDGEGEDEDDDADFYNYGDENDASSQSPCNRDGEPDYGIPRPGLRHERAASR